VRRLLSLVVAAVVLAGLPAAGHGQVPPGDSVTVSWHFGGGLGPTWNASVTCLSVNGSTAVIGFSGTESFLGETAPRAGLIRIFDGGGPDSRLDTFEWAETGGEIGGPPIPGPSSCAAYPASFPPAFGGISVNDFGDVIVTDTQALPTSKDQCKRGGWRTFGVFKNQGDCASFVATKGKNPPASLRPR
jgi:hypothetical protein